MAEYLAPGVYVEEVDTGSKPIEGVSTSTAGVVGVTERGPENIPMLITSVGEYTRLFGGQLPFNDFGRHAYLPHAIEGFFANSGKRVYVTRVASENAVAALMRLGDRGIPGAFSTILLRAAPEGSGAAGGTLIYALDFSGLGAGVTYRIGDGSAAEYRTTGTLDANFTFAPLDSPLARAHNVGSVVEEFTRTPAAGFVGAFTTAAAGAAVERGETRLILETATAADVAALTLNTLVEVAGDANPAHEREYRFIRELIRPAAEPLRAYIRLDSTLSLRYPTGATVTPIAPSALSATQPLDTGSAVGDTMLFLQNRGAAEFNTSGRLIRIENADLAQREVRRVGSLTRIDIAPPPVAAYPAGSSVESVTLREGVPVAAATATTATVTAQEIGAFALNQIIGLSYYNSPRTAPVTATITALNPVTNTITFAAPAVAPIAARDFIAPHKELTAPVAAGRSAITADNRITLNVGDLIRIGQGAEAEFVAIAALPDRSGAAPDPGSIVLAQPLTFSHLLGAPLVRLTETPAVTPAAPGNPPVPLTLDTAIGQIGPLLLSDGGNVVTAFTAAVAAPEANFVRITANGIIYRHNVVSAAAVAASARRITLTEPLRQAHPRGSSLSVRSPLMEIQALDRGEWGNRLRVSVEDEEAGIVNNVRVANITDPTHLRLASAAGVEAGTVLEFRDRNGRVVGDPRKVIGVDRAGNYTLTLDANMTGDQMDLATPATPGNPASAGRTVRSREFRLTILFMRRPDPALPTRDSQAVGVEVFRNLSMDPGHSRYIGRVIGDVAGPLRLSDNRSEGESEYVRVVDLAPSNLIRLGPEALTDTLPNGVIRPARHALYTGSDDVGGITDNTYIGADNVNPSLRTGLYSLANIDSISLVSIPGQISEAVQNAILIHCENLRYRFAVLDGPAPLNDALADVEALRQRYDSKYAALYYPWVTIPDPFPLNIANIAQYPVPPSGHILGVYARTDVERGVHKAPANEVVRGIVGLRRTLNKAQQDILNPFPVNINVIRDFRPENRGIRVYGARVITSDPDFKYVNVRRLLIYIEHSLDIGLQWVVFEPNADPLWARVRRSAANFLTGVWRDGALEGTKKEEAYFVKCDRTTMTQTDIDNGRLIVQIGVAPVKPAEFVIIRIGLWTAHADS